MYTDEELALAAQVRAFVAAELPDTVRQKVIEGAHVSPDERRAWHRALYRKGWVAPTWPAEHGGTGWDAIRNHVLSETLAEEGTPDLGAFGLKMLGPLLIHHGSVAQQQRYLPRVLMGEEFWCQGFSEPGAGSDLVALKTRAELIDGEWVINGQKMWTTMAHEANMMFALVRTDRDAPRPHQGISMLLIPMDTPGITVRPIVLLNGAQHTNEVFFDNVRVPAENLVGEAGQGWAYARTVLGNERLSIARVGWAKRQLARVKRVAAAEGVLDAPRFAMRVAEAEIDLMTLDAAAMATLQRIRSGAAPGVEANMLKIKASELQQTLAELLVEAVGPRAAPLGPEGMDPDHPWAAPIYGGLFYTRVTSIFGGSNEIQRNIIARSLGIGGRA